MFSFLKKLFCNSEKNIDEKQEIQDIHFSDIDYSYNRRIAYHELREIYGCYNCDAHREYEYWDWRNVR